MEIAIVYLIIINVLSFFCLRSDKKRAGFSRYKIGTRTFYVLAILGGSIGILIGMFYYRCFFEETKLRFVVPGILVTQILIGLLLLL